MKNSSDKIYEALKLAFAKRTDDLGSKIANGVEDNVQKLRALDMTEKELVELRACYEACFQDSMGRLQGLIALLSAFITIYLGLKDVLVDLLNLPKEFTLCIFAIAALITVFYAFFKIHKVNKDNAALRNYAMAVSVLLAEKNSKIKENADM